eukprot:6902073-Prymnesium_polylepis.2
MDTSTTARASDGTRPICGRSGAFAPTCKAPASPLCPAVLARSAHHGTTTPLRSPAWTSASRRPQD